MKILQIINSLSGGGAETQLRLLSNGLVHNGIEIGIFCVDTIGQQQYDETIKIYRWKKKSKFDLGLFFYLKRVIELFKPDIIHAWLPASMTIPAILVASIKKIPCVFSYRNKMYFHRPLSYPEYILAFLFSDRIVSNNPVNQSNSFYRLLFKMKKGVFIENGVLVPEMYKKDEVNFLSLKSLNLLFVGRITRQKNWKCLLDALDLVKSEMPVHLSICGHGEELPQLRSLVSAYSLNDKVTIRGFQSNIYPIMNKSDLLVLPSLYEGMPNVLLEAMALGLPCLISDIKAHRDITQRSNAAVFFDPKRPETLAEKIEQFFMGKCPDTMRIDSQRIACKYSVDAMIEKYHSFYIGIIQSST